ncbi:MAG: hypothetical protein GPOALKHO_000798 [Sodalis sp.]|nr:MAG: hypothetical protein GPOALKHO_000798 [Sodalis sp.]
MTPRQGNAICQPHQQLRGDKVDKQHHQDFRQTAQQRDQRCPTQRKPAPARRFQRGKARGQGRPMISAHSARPRIVPAAWQTLSSA